MKYAFLFFCTGIVTNTCDNQGLEKITFEVAYVTKISFDKTQGCDKVMFPLYGQITYQKSFLNNWSFFTDLKSGFQFYNSSFGGTEAGFIYKEQGGLLFGFDLGISKQFKKFTTQV
jgi:hypothetical protein